MKTDTLSLNVQRNRVSNNPLAGLVDDDTFFRYWYLPYVITDLFFDYVDSVLDQASLLRIEETKKECRKIRELHKDYEYLKSRYIDHRHRTSESEHMELFIDGFKKEFNAEYDLIRWKVSNKRKDLDSEMQTFIASAYMSIVVYQTVREYCLESDKVIAKVWSNKRLSHSILPQEAMDSYALLDRFLLGDKTVSMEDRNTSKERLLLTLRQVEFTDTKAS